jgi:pimeloyl-ACP methyl ester carboxylesterase
MPTITTKDGTQIYYKDWGTGQPIVFSHGWPLTADDWDGQMLFFGQRGYRVIAHDRRGHGRSTQTWDGNDMDTYADDLAALTEKLDLKNAIHVGHSTGGGEVARYIGRHGSKRVAMAVLISSVPPLMLKTDEESGGRAHRGVRRPASRNMWKIGRSFTRTSPSRSTDTTGPARRFRKASGRSGGSRDDGRDEGGLRLHQGFLRDGLHRRSKEVRRAHSHSSWR